MENLLSSNLSLNLADATKTFLHEHRQDLEPFYGSSLESNPSLIDVLNNCYNQAKTKLSGHETPEPPSEAAAAAAPVTAAALAAHTIFPPVSPPVGSRRPSEAEANKSKKHRQ